MTTRQWILRAHALFPHATWQRKRRWVRAARYAATCAAKVRIGVTHVEPSDQVFADRTYRRAA